MTRPKAQQPTEVELQILAALWEQGPSTVRQVHQHLSKVRETGYSTTLKMMQVMLEKGLLQRDVSVRPQLFRACQSKEQTQTHMLDNLSRRAFSGSAKRMVMQMVSAGRITADDLEEIQRLIESSQGDQP